jgi:hypothetical protein
MGVACGKRKEYVLVNEDDLNSSRILHNHKAEYETLDKSKIVEIDKKVSSIGKFSIINDLKKSKKNSASYYNNKETFYEYIRKELGETERPSIQKIKEFNAKNPIRFKEIIMKCEIPADLKWELWPLLINDSRFENISEAGFNVLIKTENHKVEDIVNKDVPRTFHHKEFFSSEINNVKVGREMLYKICKAVGVYFKNIGYTQGFNFLGAFIIEVSGAQELECLNFIITFLTNERFLFIGVFDDSFPMVYFMNHRFHKKLAEVEPAIHKAIVKAGLPDEVWIHKWFMSAYTGYFPSYLCSRLIELILCTDIYSMVSFTVALVVRLKKSLIGDREMVDMAELLNRSGENIELMDDIELIVKEAKKYIMSKKYIEQALSEHQRSEHYSLIKFERYGEAIRNYLKGQVDHEEINITVYEFSPPKQTIPQYNIDFEKMIVNPQRCEEVHVFPRPQEDASFDDSVNHDMDEGVGPIQLKESVHIFNNSRFNGKTVS